MVIAVDFDGTLCFSAWPDVGEPNNPLINYLKIQQKAGSMFGLPAEEYAIFTDGFSSAVCSGYPVHAVRRDDVRCCKRYTVGAEELIIRQNNVSV